MTMTSCTETPNWDRRPLPDVGGHDAVHRRARKIHPARELGQAEPLRLTVERTEDLANPRDDLDATLRSQQLRNR